MSRQIFSDTEARPDLFLRNGSVNHSFLKEWLSENHWQIPDVENEYKRGGASQYLAAWDVRRGYVMERCEPNTGIRPFGRLVSQIMSQEPYSSAKRVFCQRAVSGLTAG